MIIRGARLADIQAQQVEVGRIRLGTSQKKTSRGGKEYNEPVKLERFRLTSRSQQLIDEAAALYGGEVEPWEPERGTAQWQVIIESASLPVVVPPNACSQFYEQWTGGRCQRRCDGVRELQEDVPCPCGPDPADKKAKGCKPTTRLSLMLAEMNGIGIWRLESHGYYAAAELPAVADLLSAAGGNIPARLELEERQAEVPDPRNSGKTVISRFMVPVLHVEATPAAIVGTFGNRPALEAGPARAALPAAAAEPAEEKDQEALGELWKVYNYYQEWIDKAQTREHMLLLKDKITADGRLNQVFRENIELLWSDRARILAAGQAPSSPADPAPVVGVPAADSTTPSAATPASTPAPTSAGSNGGDRMQMWNQVAQVAAAKSLTMSALKQLFGEWAPGEVALQQADVGQLSGFKTWLEARK